MGKIFKIIIDKIGWYRVMVVVLGVGVLVVLFIGAESGMYKLRKFILSMIEERVVEIDNRYRAEVSRIDSRYNVVERRIKDIDKEYVNLKKRQDIVEKKISEVHIGIDKMSVREVAEEFAKYGYKIKVCKEAGGVVKCLDIK